MTAREWQPGDVALVRNEYNVWNVAICAVRRGRRGFVWSYGVGDSESPIEADARPLVVIDPEDREQVEMLRDLWDGAHAEQQGHKPSASAKGARGNALQAALREFADPKPPACGASLSVTYSDGKGREQECHEPRGHDGPHASEDFRWTAHYGEAAS